MISDINKENLSHWAAPAGYPWGESLGDDIEYLENLLEEEEELTVHEKDIIELVIHHLEECQKLINVLLKTKEN